MKHRILIVDDSPVIRAMLRFTLEDAGFEVEEAADGCGALLVLERARDVACLVTDINMPGINGLELVRGLRAREATRMLPALVLSAEDAPATREAALRYGATAYLAKPFVAEQLVRAISLVAG